MISAVLCNPELSAEDPANPDWYNGRLFYGEQIDDLSKTAMIMPFHCMIVRLSYSRLQKQVLAHAIDSQKEIIPNGAVSSVLIYSNK
jgi:hypothetical protein